MTKKTLLSAALAFTALTAAPSAYAATFVTFNGETGTFGHDDIPGVSFDDTFHFNVPLPGTAGGTISSIMVAGSPDIIFTSVTLNGVEFEIVTEGEDEYRRLKNQPVVAGQQTIHVVGTANEAGAAYDGTIAYAPVPEPATWAMMLGGFALVGGAMRRRSKVARLTTA